MTERPFRVLNGDGPAPMVIVCDHASNRVPPEFGDLGLAAAERTRHIAWDIGAAAISELLARRFGAPAVLSEVSRLVVDCNRNYRDPSLAPALSDGTPIPANRDLAEGERRRRWDLYHQPYHAAIEAALARRSAAVQRPLLVSIHSMTDVMNGRHRPWQIALCSERDRRLTEPMLAALRAHGGIVVGDNEPYWLDPAEDYTVPRHALGRGLAYLQVEFRQDLVADAAGQRRWAALFGDCLETVLERAH